MSFLLSSRLLTKMKEEQDVEVEVNSLYEAFQFELLESGCNVQFEKRLFVEYLLKLFPNATKTKLNINNNETTLTVYKRIVLKPLSTLITADCLDFGEVKQFLTSIFVLIKETESQLTCDVDCNIQINGNSVYKRVTFFKSKKWTLEISGKKIDLDNIFIDSTFQVCQGSITAICLSVQSLKIVKQ